MGGRAADLAAQVLDRIQIDVQFTAHPLLGQGGDPAQPSRPATEEVCEAVGTAQIQVGVVLPGDTDATENLDAVFDVGRRSLDPDGGGDRRGDG